MKIKFWGTRGSIPVPGPNTVKYGGNTPCIQITSKKGEEIILDAGTGIRELGNKIIEREAPTDIKILMSHTHWDHIQGLPFFEPLYKKNYKVNFYSNINSEESLDYIIEGQWHPVFFPVNTDVLQAKVNYSKIAPDNEYKFNELKIETIASHHSKGTISFKIKERGATVIYMTDNEILYNAEEEEANFKNVYNENNELIKFCEDADYLIHDSMYTLNDYNSKIGWGHSNNIALAHFSILAKVKNLVLFHYDPNYSDSDIDYILTETKRFLKDEGSNVNCIASQDLMELEI